MNVDGNFVLSDGGTLKINIGHSMWHDVLDVTGAVDFQTGGTLCFSPSPNFFQNMEANKINTITLKFLRADGEITGLSSVGHNFLDLPDGVRYSLDQQSDGVYITISRPNQQPVADAGEDQTVHAGVIVNLDGSGSYDPDENYPLMYEWGIVSKPANSEAELGDTSLVNPWFVPDLPGNYEIKLVVTDSVGVISLLDTVSISTFNTKPVADAGPDQALLELNVPVQFGTAAGRQSYDPDGDTITYEWIITEKPGNSEAELDDPTSPTPTMPADQYGTYEVRLVVNDPWVGSDPDTVLVSFKNLPPIACTTGNQSKDVDETVVLDGSCSTDTNNDPLTYSWQFVSRPIGSQAQIADPTADQTSFVADLPGTFVVSLVVNDGEYDSDPPAASSIYVIAHPDAVTDQLGDAMDTVNLIPPEAIKNKNLKKSLTNKFNAAMEMVDLGLYAEALDKLQGDILAKTDGCANEGKPDKNDWITDCQQQKLVYAEIMRAIIILTDLL